MSPTVCPRACRHTNLSLPTRVCQLSLPCEGRLRITLNIQCSSIEDIISKNVDNMILYLHCTSSVATLEVSFPSSLLATHRYSPLSVLFTFVIVNCFLPSEKPILELLIVSTGDPSLVHDIVGAGFAVALQDKVTLSPSIFGTLPG